jgi:hypothetical protein
MPKRRNLPNSKAGNEAFVQTPLDAKIHFLNPTAVIVWECCDGMTTLLECENQIRERFNVPASADLKADILKVIADIRLKGLLEDAGDAF